MTDLTLIQKLRQLAEAKPGGPMPSCLGDGSIGNNWGVPLAAIAKEAADALDAAALRAPEAADAEEICTGCGGAMYIGDVDSPCPECNSGAADAAMEDATRQILASIADAPTAAGIAAPPAVVCCGHPNVIDNGQDGPTPECCGRFDAAQPAASADALERAAKIAEDEADNSDQASSPYDGGSGSLGYEKACRNIAEKLRALTAPVAGADAGMPEVNKGVRP